MRAKWRRGAAIVAVLVAGSASIATTPMPQPVATTMVEYKETIELSAATPVAVRRLSVLLDSKDRGLSMEAVLAASIGSGEVPEDAIRLTVLPDQPGNQQLRTLPEEAGSPPETAFFGYNRSYPENGSCAQLPCARTYRMIVELVGDEPPDGVEVVFRAAGKLTVMGVEQVPDGITFPVEPVDDLVLLARPPDVDATSGVQDMVVGGPDRKSAGIHAMVTFRGDALSADPVWPVVPEIVLHVKAADDKSSSIVGQYVLTVEHPSGSVAGRPQQMIIAPDQLPIGVSLQPISGCRAGVPCAVAVDANLGATGPGDSLALQWWIETRVRYFDGAAPGAQAAVEITTLSEAEFAEQSLGECKHLALLVLGKAYEWGIVSEVEFTKQLAEYEARTWDPASVEELDRYDELCLAVLRDDANAGPLWTQPPSEQDPFAPQVEGSLAAETRMLSLDTPVFVRDIRLTRNAAAADPLGARALGYLQVTTSAPKADPRVILNAFSQILRVDGGDPVIQRSDITASDLAGAPFEVDPWVGCEAMAACTVDLRLVVAWWDWEPSARQEVTWQLKAGTAWPGLPRAPEGAAVTVEQLAALDMKVGADAIADRATGKDVVLAADGDVVTRRVTVEVSGGTWPAELTNVPMPGHGILTMSATGSGTGSPPMIGTNIQPADQTVDRGLGDAATVDGAALTQAFFPFNTCKGRAPCRSEYTFEFTRVGKGGDFGPVTVEWSLEATLLAFESIQFPAGAELTIQIDE